MISLWYNMIYYYYTSQYYLHKSFSSVDVSQFGIHSAEKHVDKKTYPPDWIARLSFDWRWQQKGRVFDHGKLG